VLYLLLVYCAYMNDPKDIIEHVTEHYENPIRVGSRCEANTFYRIEDLTSEELEVIGAFLVERIENVCSPNEIEVIISLPGSVAGIAKILSRELGKKGESLEVINIAQVSNQGSRWLKNTTAILVNDVITTARSCLEAHTRATIFGAQVLCWAAIIDRTFGPGPVPVVAAITGDPVRLLE
jgi:hypothetical protein